MPSASRLEATESPAIDQGVISLRLLNAFRLEVGGKTIDVPLGVQRVVAFLALRSYPVHRSQVAGTLWLDVPEARAAANLRSALWRLHTFGLPLVAPNHGTLGLDPRTVVDFHEGMGRARRWMAGTVTEDDIAAGPVSLEGELLPDWYDDWVVAERERYRQVRLHGLEAMAEGMIRRDRFGDALLAALAAVVADPLRETAHRALIRVHLAEGNVGEAVRQLRRCERVFSDELGVAPSSRLAEMIAHLEPPPIQRSTSGSRGSTAIPIDASRTASGPHAARPASARSSTASALR